jgi:hypothetical protein
METAKSRVGINPPTKRVAVGATSWKFIDGFGMTRKREIVES